MSWVCGWLYDNDSREQPEEKRRRRREGRGRREERGGRREEGGERREERRRRDVERKRKMRELRGGEAEVEKCSNMNSLIPKSQQLLHHFPLTSRPPPRQEPLMAAMTGLPLSSSLAIIAWPFTEISLN